MTEKIMLHSKKKIYFNTILGGKLFNPPVILNKHVIYTSANEGGNI